MHADGHDYVHLMHDIEVKVTQKVKGHVLDILSIRFVSIVTKPEWIMFRETFKGRSKKYNSKWEQDQMGM